MVENKRYYILVGEKQNWVVSIDNKVWGFSERSKGSWNKILPNELVAFYVTRPIKKIIGFGRIERKFVDKTILWSDDEFFGRTMWPYRISLEILYVTDNWEENGISVPSDILIQVSRRVISKELFYDLVNKAEIKWHVSIPINAVENP
jgi:predicted RNA-binding protein